MKKILALALVLFVSLNMAFAQSTPRAKVVCGPYVQCMSETGFTVIWTTDVDAVAWVEVAPDEYAFLQQGKRQIL